MSLLAPLFKPVTILAGVLLVLSDALGLFVFPSESFSQAIQTPIGQAVGVVSLAATFLTLLTFVLLHVRQGDRAGGFGLVAFLFVLLGVMMSFGASWLLTFVAPTLGQIAPRLLDTGPPPGVIISFVLLGLGLLLYGLVTFLAGMFSRVGAVLLMLGGIASALPFLPVGSAALTGVALIWLAVAPARAAT
jgi:hypothetical protein